MRYLLDANVCIGLLKGDESLKARLRTVEPVQVVLCSVVKAELSWGAWNSGRVEENLRIHAAFAEPYESLPFDDRAAAEYGILRADLKKRGALIGANDMLIAAIALANGCILVTRNHSEFHRVRGLRVETWDN